MLIHNEISKEVLASSLWLIDSRDTRRSIYNDVVSRSATSMLLGDSGMVAIAKNWTLYDGQQTGVITKRLNELGFCSPSKRLVKYVERALGCYRYLHLNRDKKRPAISDSEYDRLFKNIFNHSYTKQLRCAICGYHFTESDVSNRMQSFISDNDLKLASIVDERRQGYLHKPVSFKGKDSFFTAMEIDHIIPVSGLGWGNSDNLQVLCCFCNRGKGNHLFPHEGFSFFSTNFTDIAYEYPPNWENEFIGFARLFVSVIWSSSGVSNRGACIDEVELTVRLKDPNKSVSAWNLDVVSYDELSM